MKPSDDLPIARRRLLAAACLPALLAMAGAGAQTPPGWDYQRTAATRQAKAQLTAQVSSANVLPLVAPLEGAARGRLVIEQSNRNGLVAWVAIDRGTLVCEGYNHCRVQVQFDDGDATSFQGMEPKERAGGTLYLLPAERLLDGARKARVVRVSLFLHGQGLKTLEFRSAKPLEWALRR